MRNVKLMSIISFVLAILTMAYAVLGGGIDARTLLDIHGLVIVIGGTVAATAISFNPVHIIQMFRALYRGMLTGKEVRFDEIIRQLMKLADVYRNNPERMRQSMSIITDEFLRESINLMLDEITSERELLKILNERVDHIYDRYISDARKFKAIGKFPPAMGLMGAVLGMIGLLGGLGSPGAEKTVGPSLSVALVATFYGIALANLVIIPIGENLVERAAIIKRKNIIIVAGVRLILEESNPILLAEKLNSFLLPNERLDWRATG
ncbi:MAG: transporter, MotA/TolQ/ExbB proton channel family protein [Pseudomonadota bacterium]|jgi:chemotaxis protein MotA